MTYQYVAKNVAAIAALGSPIASSDFRPNGSRGRRAHQDEGEGSEGGRHHHRQDQEVGQGLEFMSFRLVIAGQYDSIETVDGTE